MPQKRTGEPIPFENGSDRVTLAEHNQIISRIRLAIMGFFEPTRVPVYEIPLTDEVLNRSAADVLASPAKNQGSQNLNVQEWDEEEEARMA